MTVPARPLKQHLAEVPGPPWEVVERGLARRRRRRVAVLVLTPVCALALFALRRPSEVPPTPARVALAVGAPMPAGVTVLGDGSRVELRPGAALRLASRDASRVVFALLAGEASFEVTPARRDFRVDAGLVSVTVVGTGFSVARGVDRVRVSVRHGAVRVEGDRVAGGVVTLRGGESIEVSSESPAPQGITPQIAQVVDAGVRARPAWVRRASRDGGAPAADGATTFDAAMLAPGDVPAPPNAAEDLWRRADVLRRAQSLEAAGALLRRIAEEHPTSPRAPMAAMVLGRDLLHAMGRPAQAASAFARALALDLPESLREDAWLGLIESRARAGDREGAARAAETYRARFPRGVHRAYIDALVGAAP